MTKSLSYCYTGSLACLLPPSYFMPTKKKQANTSAKKSPTKAAQNQKKKRPGRRPGRPKKDGELRDKILDCAEEVFAEDGYLGSSTRQIAVRAGVTQPLIRYYFASKEQLYQEVFRRRGALLAARRIELLDQLINSDKPYDVSDVIRAYLEPQWEIKHDHPGGAAFVGLQARLHSEPEEHALRLRREVYDEPVKHYLKALAPLLPHVPKHVLSVRMSFLVGTYLFMLNDLGRIGDFTDGQVNSLGREEMLAQLVSFLSAGLSADIP